MKTIILNEAQERAFISMLVKPGGLNDKQYSINPAQVLIVKKFLDGGYKRGQREEIGPDGDPCLIPLFGMLDSSKMNILQNLEVEEMLEKLESKFNKMGVDEDERHKLLGKILEDWYNNKIGPYGNLSVNHV